MLVVGYKCGVVWFL